MKKSKSYWYRLLFISLMVFSFSAYGENTLHPDVQKMIQANQEPEGVVFEVETLDGDALNKLAGYIKFQVEQVRKAYPSVDLRWCLTVLKSTLCRPKNSLKMLDYTVYSIIWSVILKSACMFAGLLRV